MLKWLASVFLILLFPFKPEQDPQVKRMVVINELMPSNSTLPDPSGEFDDWIELYNLSQESVDLSGWFLTDDKKNPGRWKFPEGVIVGPGQYLIIWADNNITQQGLHANFKLSAQGETIILLDNQKRIVDEVRMKPQSKDLTFSRIPDGSDKFRWGKPTPGEPNLQR